MSAHPKVLHDIYECDGLDYDPPTVVTLVGRRNRNYYKKLESWSPPPGWEQFPSILDFPVYPARRPGLLLRTLNGALIIHDPITLDRHSLNETAVGLLQLCDGSRQFSEICEEYARKHDLCLDRARREVRPVLADLFEKRVLLARDHRVCADAYRTPALPRLRHSSPPS